MPSRTIAGRYVVVQAVGHGGMGTVWLCRDEVLSRRVAVKEIGSLPGRSTSDLARALREARNTAALNHHNVVSIYDVVEDGGSNWLVMEFVPSRNLSDVVAEDGPLAPERLVWIGAQAADGLAAAHERGTIHRDVKPGNILVTDDDRVKISDFGIARTSGDAQLTSSGIVTGTPAYFAPELARGEDPTLAADVWSLGASLYAAVEGKLPYPDQGNAIALLTQIASEPPPTPERAGFLTDPIQRMMDPDPSTRWTMSDAAHTLHRLHDRHRPRSGPDTVSLETTLGGTGASSDDEPVVAESTPTNGDRAVISETPEPVTGPAGPSPAPHDGDGPARPDETAPLPDVQAPAGDEPDPTRSNDRDLGRQDRSVKARRTALTAALLLIALSAVVAVVLTTRDDPNPSTSDRSGRPEATSSATPSATAGSGTDEGDGQTTSSSARSAGFVEDYYSHLPRDTKTSWAQLAPKMQDEVGGYSAYTGFWRTITAVRVDRTTPVARGVVDVKLTYSSKRGDESETRRLHVEEKGDSFLIVGDEVV